MTLERTNTIYRESDTVSDALSFSSGVDKVIEALRPHSRASTAFPAGLVADDARLGNGETLQQWFVRLVDGHCGRDPGGVALEENIALFASLRWQGDRLIWASVPALVCPCDLSRFYADPEAGAIYLRLDLNYDTLGEPFSHPLAHIHVGGDGYPRFALDGGNNGNILLDYIEFIYRTYVPNEWLSWARRRWMGAPGAQEGEFEEIINAFRENQFRVLRSHATTIQRMKKVLREAKDSLFAAHMAGTDREILEYPSARWP